MADKIGNLPTSEYKPDGLDIEETTLANYTKSKYPELLNYEKKELLGIDTGFEKLNKRIYGLRGLVILAGEPKLGKTSYILQLAFQSAKKKTPVIFYSLEMTRFQITTRILSRLSQIPYIDILLNGKTNNEIDNDINTIKRIDNFYIRSLEDITGKIDFTTLESEIKLVKNKHNADNILVVVDHLQIFPEDRNFSNIIEKEQYLIQKFNEIQKRTEATIVLISQVNKSAMDRPNTGLSSVKGSVDLIYLASLILQLKEEKQTTTTENPNYKYIKLDITSRDTAGGEIPITFKTPTHTFIETEKPED